MQAAIQGLLETAFFAPQGLRDQRLGPDQFGKGLAHLARQGGHQTPHQRIFRAHHMGMTHGPAHDPAQHIAAPFVGRKDAVGDQK